MDYCIIRSTHAEIHDVIVTYLVTLKGVTSALEVYLKRAAIIYIKVRIQRKL